MTFRAVMTLMVTHSSKAFSRMRNLLMKSVTFGRVSEDTFVNRKKFVSMGVIPPTLLQLETWSEFLSCVTRNLVARKSVVADSLRVSTHSTELDRFRAANMKTFRVTKLKRDTESQVNSCPTLPRFTVIKVLQTTLTMVTVTMTGVQNLDVAGKTGSRQWTTLNAFIPLSMLTNSMVAVGADLPVVLGS